jgi:hypothetical protein
MKNKYIVTPHYEIRSFPVAFFLSDEQLIPAL